MSAPRRTAVLPALAIVLIAGLVSACGVKGDLEPPPGANLSAQPAAESSVKTNSTLLEQSRITHENPHDILPQMPPKEWSKKRDRERDAKAPAREAAPQKPFVLDWLL